MTFVDRDVYSQTNELRYTKKSYDSLWVQLGEFFVDKTPKKVDVAGEVVELWHREIQLSVLKESTNDDFYDDEANVFEGHVKPSEVLFEHEYVTIEQGIAHFAYFYPELAASINQLIDGYNDNEDDITLALAKLEIPQIEDKFSVDALHL